jgi:hypothetical protein
MDSTQGSHPTPWPPPQYVPRAIGTTLAVGAAGAGFSGHATAAGILASMAAALFLIDVIKNRS